MVVVVILFGGVGACCIGCVGGFGSVVVVIILWSRCRSSWWCLCWWCL